MESLYTYGAALAGLVVAVGVILYFVKLSRSGNAGAYIGPRPNELHAHKRIPPRRSLLGAIFASPEQEEEEVDYEQELDAVSTFDEAFDFLEFIPEADEEGYDEDLETRAFRKALALAETPDEADSVYGLAPEDSDVQREALIRRLDLIDSVPAVIDLLEDFDCESDYGELVIIRAAEILRPR